MASAIDPAAVRAPPPTKKISSAFWMVFSRWAMITLVVASGSLASAAGLAAMAGNYQHHTRNDILHGRSSSSCPTLGPLGSCQQNGGAARAGEQ